MTAAVLELFAVARSHDADEVEVLYRSRTTPPGRGQVEMLEYGRELQRIAQRRTVLPFRYGTTVADEDELERLVEEHRQQWLDRLAVVSGHVELIVHAAPSRDAWKPRTGREYIMAKKADHDVEASVLAAVAPYAREVRVLQGGRVACLVPDYEAEQVLNVIQLTEPTADCTGPWPPFSFVEPPV